MARFEQNEKFVKTGLTFDDVLLVPAESGVLPADVDLHTRLTKKITLNIPVMSAAMDTVTESRMAIALATEGGLSFIYGSQTIEDQAAMVARVKDYKAGFVTSDANLSPDMTLADVVALLEKHGHSTMPVTHDGSPHGRPAHLILTYKRAACRAGIPSHISHR